MRIESRMIKHPLCGVFAVCFALSLLPAGAAGQTTISTGSIVGTVTDPTGAIIAGASIAISSKSTGEVANVVTTGAGTYNSGGLIPGDYVVRVGLRDSRPL